MINRTKSGSCVALRSARPADLAAVLSLLGRSSLPTAGIADALPHFVIAENGAELVGVAGLEVYGDSALLRSVAVEKSWQKSGVGQTLIERALSVTRERGIKDVFLLTTTAEHYFPRFGFTCVSRDSVSKAVQESTEFKGACPASAVVMRKSFAEETQA